MISEDFNHCTTGHPHRAWLAVCLLALAGKCFYLEVILYYKGRKPEKNIPMMDLQIQIVYGDELWTQRIWLQWLCLHQAHIFHKPSSLYTLVAEPLKRKQPEIKENKAKDPILFVMWLTGHAQFTEQPWHARYNDLKPLMYLHTFILFLLLLI